MDQDQQQAEPDDIESYKRQVAYWRGVAGKQRRRADEAELFIRVAVAAAGGEMRIPRRLFDDPPQEIKRWTDMATFTEVLAVR